MNNPNDSKVKEYYALLGCTSDSTIDEITKNYRVKSKKFHPDVLHSKDLPNEILQFSKEKFLKFTEAKDFLINEVRNKSKNADFKEREEEEKKHKEREKQQRKEVKCVNCGVVNRIPEVIPYGLIVKYGKCGNNPYVKAGEANAKHQGENRIPCADGTCIGLIKPDGRCSQCGKTLEEGAAADAAAQKLEQDRQLYGMSGSIFGSAALAVISFAAIMFVTLFLAVIIFLMVS